ncbi:MAG: hypothetical protein ACR2NR_00105 [Solirubrobacteraceae bacterium]
MKRILKVLVMLVVIVGCVPAIASAASSPTTISGAASSVGDTSAVLHGRVNPNAVPTTYLFDYGTTAALGAESVAKSAGHGSKGVDVATAITGLTPGTVYYYRISALSAAGGATGALRTFTTTGHLPPAVVTGPAINVRKTVATPTGLINSNGAPTSWQVQYGLGATYGLSTTVTALAPVVASPLPVSVEIPGLAPATLFHYRIVAYHGSLASVGADATFFTQPDRRPSPRFSPRTTPGKDGKAPYSFTTSGTLTGASFIPAVYRCTGKVGVRFYNGKRQLAVVVAQVGGDCKFSAQTSFRHTRGKGAVPLRVTVSFRGNSYIAPVNRTSHVTAG